MVNVLGVAFTPPSGESGGAAHQALEMLKREHWRAPGAAQLTLEIMPMQWWGAAEAVLAQPADAIVLIADAPGLATIAPRYARNEADPAARDVAGLSWPGVEIAPRGPAAHAATLPASRLAAALTLAGLPAHDAAFGPADAVNHCFYRLLARRGGPLVGLVRLAASLESARSEGAGKDPGEHSGGARANRVQILEGVRAALAFAAACGEARLDKTGPNL